MSAVRYERVWVIGGPGTGKTTFARRYAELSGSPCVVLDEHFWLDDWVQASDAAFAQALEAALAGGRWVVDGDYPVVVDRFLDRAECLVWLEPPFLVSYGRLVRRTLTRLVTREPMWSTSNNRESVRSVFGPRSILVYAIRTREEQRARAEHAAAAVRAGGRPVFRLRRTDPTAAATELALGTLEATGAG